MHWVAAVFSAGSCGPSVQRREWMVHARAEHTAGPLLLPPPLLLLLAVRAAPAVAADAIRGSLDNIVGAGFGCHPPCGTTAMSVSGWAVDPQLEGGRTPVNVSLLVDGKVVAVGTADLPRPDLVEAGVAPDPNHGFVIVLPGRVAQALGVPSQHHALEARVGSAVLRNVQCGSVTCQVPDPTAADCVESPQQAPTPVHGSLVLPLISQSFDE